MRIEVLRGREAYDRMEDADFVSAWTALLLAVDRKTNQLAACGVPNAEYYVWLAQPGNEHFITGAVREIWKAFPRGRLRFMFLPPKTPLAWRSSPAPEAARTILIPIERPLCVLSAHSGSESLRKKSNRSRPNRLERLGQLEFVELSSRSELERHIDRIADYCDLRQAAVNGSIPFQEDAPKREFFLRLVEEPSVAHCTALTLNGEAIAIHFGFRNGREVVLGLIAHSPFLARHSPGKLLLLFLMEKLAATGYDRFDLTQGGAYKDRFHNDRDEAFRLWAFARKRDYIAMRLKFAARRYFKRADGATGGNLRKLQTAVSRKRAHFPEEIRHKVATEELVHCRVDCIRDLLLYRPASRRDASLSRFLQSCLETLIVEITFILSRRTDACLHCSWQSEPESAGKGESDLAI